MIIGKPPEYIYVCPNFSLSETNSYREIYKLFLEVSYSFKKPLISTTIISNKFALIYDYLHKTKLYFLFLS